VSLPVIVGTTGFTRMMQAGGEVAVARAAGRAGIPYTLSTYLRNQLHRRLGCAASGNRDDVECCDPSGEGSSSRESSALTMPGSSALSA